MTKKSRKFGFVLPGLAMFVTSIALMQSGALFPELGESLALTGVGVLLFFFDISYVTLKALGAI